MKRVRSRLSLVAMVAVAIVAWIYLAPNQIGGSTTYVITRGISMEPRFHTGDLALVRPANEYQVGQVVAYRSTLLHVTVLHRIIARAGNRYVFKGDNNSFIDPTRPTRSELMGTLWVHIPHGGVVLGLLHTPAVAAIVCALLGLLLFAGVGHQRRRRRRRGDGGKPAARAGSAPAMKTRSALDFMGAVNFGALIPAAAIAAAVFLVLGAFAFTRPEQNPTTTHTHYTQQVTFGYTAAAPVGPVYPQGVVHTGDPIFLQLVHRLGVGIRYRLTSSAPHTVTGTESVLLKLTGPSGWSHTIVLAPPTRFTSDRTSTTVTINVPHVQALLAQVTKLTGVPTSGYTIAVMPQVRVAGTVAGQLVNAEFNPTLSLGLQPLQLVPGALSSARNARISAATSAPSAVTVFGVSPRISTLRLIAVIGLLISGLLALFAYVRRRAEPFEETARINAQYGHMIVPIIAGEDLGWPPVDVPTIKALVRLADVSQRLILHNRSAGVDTYLVNDEGTVYRYQVRPSKVVWGEWAESPTPMKRAA